MRQQSCSATTTYMLHVTYNRRLHVDVNIAIIQYKSFRDIVVGSSILYNMGISKHTCTTRNSASSLYIYQIWECRWVHCNWRVSAAASACGLHACKHSACPSAAQAPLRGGPAALSGEASNVFESCCPSIVVRVMFNPVLWSRRGN